MKYNDMTFGQMEAVINKLGGMDGVHRFLSGETVVSERIATSNVFTLSVNYSRTIEDGIAAGKYDWTNKDTTSSHFPSKEVGTKEVSVELVYFGRNITTDEALSELDKAGIRPATLKELLTLGEKYPNLQREFPIIALGSVWQSPDGHRYCAYLYGHDSKRGLHLNWLGSRWSGRCRFAAVRK